MTELENMKVTRNERVVYRDLSEDEGAVLLHLDTGAYHGVNNVGGAIWKLLEEEDDVEQVVAKLRLQLRGAPPDLAEEVWEFLHALDQRDLVSIERPFPVEQGDVSVGAGSVTNNGQVRDSDRVRAEARHRTHRSRSTHAHPSKPESEATR